MQHTMSKPCKECPFRNDLDHGYLTGERVTEIVESLLRGCSFPCHKTIRFEDTEDGEERIEGSHETQCAGAEIFLAHQGASTQMSRIAERLGMNVATLDMTAPVCRTHGEMLAIHGHQEEFEPCHVVNEDCLHPAGYAIGGGVVECTDGEETRECIECGQPVCENCSTDNGEGWICVYCADGDEQSI